MEYTKEEIIARMQKKYEEVEIKPSIYEQAYYKVLKRDKAATYFNMKKELDNYIISKMEKNPEYEIFMLERAEYIYKRFCIAKKAQPNLKLLDQAFYDCIETYDENEDYDTQLVKELKKF